MELSSIVNVVISRQTTQVSAAGFGTGLIVGPNGSFSAELVRTYTGMDGVAADFLSSTDEYKAAAKYFGQKNKPEKLKIGISTAAVAGIWALVFNQNLAAGDVVSLKVNGRTISVTYATSADATLTALATAIQADEDVLTAVANAATETITITGETGSALAITNLTITTTAGTTATLTNSTPSVTMADRLAAISVKDNDWYALILTDNSLATVLQAASYIQTQPKIFFVRTAEAGALASTTTDIAARLFTLAYDRTAVIYHAVNNEFADAAWAGLMLPELPGSATYKFKTLTGVAYDNLTPTQETNALSKKCNIYTRVGGVNMTSEGTMASGEWIDIIVGIDWLQTRMKERIFGTLVNQKKVPFTARGINLIVSDIRAQLQIGVDNTLLSEEPAFEVTSPDVALIPASEKNARVLSNIKFKAYLAGAIQKTTINGIVTV